MEEVGQTRDIIRDLHYAEVRGRNGVKRWRIALYPPGGKAGVQQAGVLGALEDAGIPARHFDIIGGLSAGAYNATAQSAGKAHRLRSVYEHLCDVPFLFPQWWKGEWYDPQSWFGEWMNLEYLHELLASLGLDDEPREKWPDLRIGVSDMQGKLRFLAARDTGSVLDLCRASASVLPLTKGVKIEGEHYVDGGHAHPCPIRALVRDIYARGDEVDVLVVANRPHPRHMSLVELVMFQSLVYAWLPWYSWSLCSATARFDEKIAEAARMAERRREWIRIGMLFPEPADATLQFEWRKDAVRESGHKAYWQTASLIAHAKPTRQI